jgi:hypothetical protein
MAVEVVIISIIVIFYTDSLDFSLLAGRRKNGDKSDAAMDIYSRS